MAQIHTFTLTTFFLALFVSASVAAQEPALAGSSWQPVEQALGKPGSLEAGGVFKVSMPRNDLKLTIKAQQITPLFALESWTAFKRVGKEAVMRGELILTPDEVAPAIGSLQSSGIELSG